MRQNLGPEGEVSDADLHDAPLRCGLIPRSGEDRHKRYHKFKLDARVTDEGNKFSLVGSRP